MRVARVGSTLPHGWAAKHRNRTPHARQRGGQSGGTLGWNTGAEHLGRTLGRDTRAEWPLVKVLHNKQDDSLGKIISDAAHKQHLYDLNPAHDIA